MPIGNLTSQLFANVYLDPLDKRMKYTLGTKYYGRYVDDFIIIHESKEFLVDLIPQIKVFLETEL
ncbi:RNA-directed DNA polymerase [Patescibacteria group bacterium]|nr:RNA-directed DNA polymerase [Patescibacteria group bacterium]